MKKLFFITKYILAGLIVLSFSACSEDFLERSPEDALTLDNFYQTTEQVNASTAALYGWPWFDFNDKAAWCIGDAMGGNHWSNDGNIGQFFVFGVTQNNPHLNEAWNSFFRVVAHSNAVINNVPAKAGATVPESLKKRVVAEARYMRAVAYFYLVRLWGAVPIIENNSKIVFDAKVPKNIVPDVYRFIINDLEFAAENLPASYSGSDKGRVSSWSAKSMLAKVYLYRSGLNQSGTRLQADLDKAKEYAGDVVKNSGLSLMADYADLFKTKNNNSSESMFAFQWVACNSQWGTQNTNQAYWAVSSELTGVGDGWGGYTGPSIDLIEAYEPNDLRRKSTFMMHGDFYPELMTAKGGFTYDTTKYKGPTFTSIKKYVVGTPEDNGGKVCFMSTGINTYVQRLADVYLIYADAILGNDASTSNAEAINAYNKIRERAGLSTKESITFMDIFKERRIEFAYEADYWYDLIRLHMFKPQEAIDILNNQERGTYGKEDGQLIINSRKFTVTDADFVFPIPSSESDKNPKLLEEPVPYYTK